VTHKTNEKRYRGEEVKGIFENKEIRIEGFSTDALKKYVPMFHSHGEILYVEDGIVTVTVEGNQKELSAGEMCVVFPYCVHSYEPKTVSKVSVVLFSPEGMGEFSDLLLSKRLENYFFDNVKDFLPLLKKTVDYAKKGTALHLKTAGAYLKALLGEIVMSSGLTDIKASDVDAVRSVLGYCAEHFCDDIRLKDVADNVYLSERYVTKIFSERVGCSFRDYINTLRISRAKQLIEDTSMSITDIMYECGFRNQSTFNRVFLKETGYSPREFKKAK